MTWGSVIRVPLMVSWPVVLEGGTINRPTDYPDPHTRWGRKRLSFSTDFGPVSGNEKWLHDAASPGRMTT